MFLEHQNGLNFKQIIIQVLFKYSVLYNVCITRRYLVLLCRELLGRTPHRTGFDLWHDAHVVAALNL